MPGGDSLSLIASANYDIWIVNTSSAAVDLKAMELFGLSTGIYVQKAAGVDCNANCIKT